MAGTYKMLKMPRMIFKRTKGGDDYLAPSISTPSSGVLNKGVKNYTTLELLHKSMGHFHH